MGFFEVFSAALAGFYAFVESYGLAIILLTIAVRIILLPLSIKQTRSMREMQRIQPELKQIQKKHKGDRTKMNEEMMALYKEHGVNPFGGCAPLLLQFPVLIGLFYVVRSPLKYLGYCHPDGCQNNDPIPPWEYVAQPVAGFMETLQQSRLTEVLHSMSEALSVHNFLGLRLDCSTAAALRSQDPSLLGEVCGTGVISALPYLVLVLLMGFTTWYQQKQMMARQTPGGSDIQAQQMQMMGRIMPIMLMVFAYNFPTGVVLYWLTTNVWTIGQQRIMFQAASHEPGKPDKPTKPAKPAKETKELQPAATDGDPAPKTNSKPHPSSKKKRKKR